MLFGGHTGSLELRQVEGGARLRGRFPYGVPTELAPRRVEVIAPRAFASSVNGAQAGIYLLSGHDFEKPLASQESGTLELRDDNDALTFEATVSDATTWGRDFLAAHAAGLIRGLSPGFRVASGGQRVDREGDTVRRTVFAAELVELSAVTRPAYDQAQIAARSWSPDHWTGFNRAIIRANAMQRWR